MRFVRERSAMLMHIPGNALFAKSNCLIEINKLFLTVTANVNKAVYAPVC
jgi:hypothetical protein